MIQFNLLPDIKLQYIKSRQLQRLVMLISGIVSGVTLIVFVFLVVLVDFIQKADINSITTAITSDSNKINDVANLDKILTVQNQLKALPTLEGADPQTSKIFTYIAELTPSNANITQLTVNYTPQAAAAGTAAPSTGGLPDSLIISGQADTLTTVNTFVDTLKFTKYTTSTETNPTKLAFSHVVLSQFGDSSTSGATFQITANFDPTIFKEGNNAALYIPTEITTRSDIDQPSDLFQSSPSTTNQTSH